ncbi:thioredoxin family protein [Pedobacter sp. ASV1-7]|uniref:TlpA family protein disulfide reductase n=1 Tax=Pedobacter sp. ASV1-7 TaxID=3145237 RepID=UPI0032E8C02A
MRFTIFSFLFIVSFLCAKAQPKERVKVAGFFTGQIKDYDPSTKDSLMVAYYPDQSLNTSDEPQFFIHPDENGEFKFEIPPVSHPIRILFGLFTSKPIFINDYLMEPGDKIHMEIRYNEGQIKVKYTGNGASKYAAKDLISIENDLCYERVGAYESSLQLTTSVTANFDSLQVEKHLAVYNILNESLIRVNKILDQIRNKRSKSMYRLIKADQLSFYGSNWLLQSRFFLNNCKSNKLKKKIIDRYNQFKSELYFKNAPINAYSLNVINLNLQEARFDLYLENELKPYSYTRLYQRIKTSYTGRYRERMLLHFFNDPANFQFITNYSQVEFGDCLTDALSYFKDPPIIALIRRKLLLKKGALAYDFTMPDQNGQLHNLHDFRGSVVLVDVWGEGCTACTHFSSVFKKEVYPHLKDLENFKVISISIDRKKEVWQKGINSGRYTQQTFTNLYTAGIGVEHPFLEYYNVKSIPFLLLVDKYGRIYTEFQASMKSSQILSIIHRALSE